MTYIIPPNGKHSQTNKNDISGTIYQSKNINLDEEGYIKLSDASFAVITTDDSADFDIADAMYPSASDIYVNSVEVFSLDVNTKKTFTNRSSDTGSPDPGSEDDVIYFNNTEVVTDAGVVYYRSASTTWTSVTMSFAESAPMAMTVWGAENSLAVGRGSQVKFINTSWAVNGTTLQLPNEYKVSSMTSVGNTLYVATRHDAGGEAAIFTVSAIQASADSLYGCGTFEIPSIVAFKSSVVGINSLGQLIRFTGGGFQELACLPVYPTSVEWTRASSDYSTVSNRGMVVDGDLVYINLNAFTQDGRLQMLPNFPGGIWCYDDNLKSLYHKYSATTNDFKVILGTSVTVNSTDNNFTLTSGNLNDVSTGLPLFYNDDFGTSIPELNETTCYYLIKVSSTVFKIATTYTNALAGTAIDITGTGNTGQYWSILRINDYGWFLDNDRKAIAVLNSQLYDTNVAGRIAFTADLFSKTAVGTNKTVLCGISPLLPNRGYFITPKLNSPSLENMYNTVSVKYRPLGVDEQIIIKGKKKIKKGFPFSSVQGNVTTKWIGTWTDTDSFTSTQDLSQVIAGDEIEIISGVGAGHIAHVSSISVSSGTYTVNLDTAFPYATANDLMYFVVDNWTSLATIDSTTATDIDYYQFSYDQNSKFTQFKIEMRGVGITIEEFKVSSQEQMNTRI